MTEIKDKKIVFNNFHQSSNGLPTIDEEVANQFEPRSGWSNKLLRLAWDLSKVPGREKCFGGAGINLYEPNAAKQFGEDFELGIYESPITLQEFFKVLPKVKEIFEEVEPLLEDWDYSCPQEKEAIQVQIAGYKKHNGIAPHNDFPGGFEKSMVLINDCDGFLQFGETARSTAGKGFPQLKVPYNKGDCLVILFGASGEKGWKHSVDGKKYSTDRISIVFRQVNLLNRKILPENLKTCDD